MVKEIIGYERSEQKLWYSLKYNKEILIAVEGDMDVRMIFKENDEHDSLYVGSNDASRRRPQKHVVKPRGEIIELFDDDEIIVASNDVGDEETAEIGADEGTQGRGVDEVNNKSDSFWPRSSLFMYGIVCAEKLEKQGLMGRYQRHWKRLKQGEAEKKDLQRQLDEALSKAEAEATAGAERAAKAKEQGYQ
ncbi:hypothetical protein Cgig2_007180 [Carnegiea gigantea]|uniref:Uncharacterized protein n=1 Tax=Carnegiea gigantea TaxID=171969 RepID=A0A9Q1QGC3_9CARY|nr:hypothetical protein Cgig2_007180 [Carnegiea gigantea]